MPHSEVGSVERTLKWPEELPALNECKYYTAIGEWDFQPRYHLYDMESLLALGAQNVHPPACKHAGQSWVQSLEDAGYCEWMSRTCSSSQFSLWYTNLKAVGFAATEAWACEG